MSDAHPVAGAETSVDNAAALIAGMREPAEAESTQEALPEPEAPEPVQEAEAVEIEAEAEVAEAVETEAEIDESGEEGEAEEVEATTEPPISWSKADKDEFSKLPPEVQHVVAEREQQRDTAFQTKTTELSDQKKQLNEAVELAQQQSLGQLQQAQALMAQAMEAAGFGAEPDWDSLRTQLDREDYMDVKDQWDTNLRKFGQFQTNFQQMQQQTQAAQQEKQQEFVQAQIKENAERWPEFADLKTRNTALEGMFSFLEGEGIARDLSANLVDAKMISVVRKAMAYDALQAKAPAIQKAVKKAPKMARPGSVKSKQRVRTENVRDALKQAKSTNSARDLAGVFAALRQTE